MSFVDACVNCGVEPVMLSFFTTDEVYKELMDIARKNDIELPELLRIVIDDFILHQPV